VVCLQNLCRQLAEITEIPDGFLLAEAPFHLHVNMLGVFLQNILLFLFFQHSQAVLKFI
jgi:hypothetical protein